MVCFPVKRFSNLRTRQLKSIFTVPTNETHMLYLVTAKLSAVPSLWCFLLSEISVDPVGLLDLDAAFCRGKNKIKLSEIIADKKAKFHYYNKTMHLHFLPYLSLPNKNPSISFSSSLSLFVVSSPSPCILLSSTALYSVFFTASSTPYPDRRTLSSDTL